MPIKDDEKRKAMNRERMRKARAGAQEPRAPHEPVHPSRAPREALAKPKRKGANFPKRCPECGYAHERHCSPELIAMFRERMVLPGKDGLIDAETRAVLREHVR